MSGVVLVDSDTLSELARGNARVVAAAGRYLSRHGRLTFAAVTAFERMRGYRSAIARGRPYDLQLRRFVSLCEVSIVLPVDAVVADHGATIWARVGARARGAILDLLIVATASAHGAGVATRNGRDFNALAAAAPRPVPLIDWAS